MKFFVLCALMPSLVLGANMAVLSSRPPAASSVADPTILWWKCNDGSGTNISAAVGPAGTTDASWTGSTQSGSGFALDFNGTDDDAWANTNVTYGVQTITVTFWLYVTSYTAGQMLFESSTNYTNGSGRYQIRAQDGVINVSLIDNASGTFIGHFTPGSTSAWHHYAVIINNATGTQTAYLDGAAATVTTDFSNWASAGTLSTQDLYVGNRAEVSVFLAGRIDDIRIYNSALSAGDVLAIYNAGAQ
jgi:Concanavalin A-like lectin/glucanases superfamily